MNKGRHLLVDCKGAPPDVCLNDAQMLQLLTEGIRQAGAQILSFSRHKLGLDSPPGYAIVIALDESHCSAHSYADLGLIAMDLFTCGKTNPRDVFEYVASKVDLGEVTITEVNRFNL